MLYVRNVIIEATQKTSSMFMNRIIKAYNKHTKHSNGDDVEATVNFNGYVSSSLEATVETAAKARPDKAIMSAEASVGEMHDDSKGEEWKAEEIKRLCIENGAAEIQKPVILEFDDLGGKTPIPSGYPQDE